MLLTIKKAHTIQDVWTQIGNKTARLVEAATFSADINVRHSFYVLWGSVIRVTVDRRSDDMPLAFVKGEAKDIFEATFL